MSKGTAIDLGLTEAYNDLFSTQEERDNAGRTFVIDLDPAEISDFPNHPFHVRMDEEMERLVASVKERGVLSLSWCIPCQTVAIRWCQAIDASWRQSWQNSPNYPVLSGN